MVSDRITLKFPAWYARCIAKLANAVPVALAASRESFVFLLPDNLTEMKVFYLTLVAQ